MPSNDPGTVVADHLVTEGVVTAKGTDVFDSPPLPPDDTVPEKVIFCFETGGQAPIPYLGGANPSGSDHNRRLVQIRTRSPKHDYADGVTLARAARDAVHRAVLTGFFGVLARESAPTYLGMNDQDQHEWSNNIELWSKE